MGRTRNLSYALWSTVAGVGLAACGSDETVGHLADARPPPDAATPVAALSATLNAMAECGVVTPPTSDLVIANTGNAELVIRAADADGGFTVVTALPVTIAAGAEATLAIRPPASVIGTDRGGSTKPGTLTLSTNEAATPVRTVALRAEVVGANIAFTDDMGYPVTLTFADATGACPAPQAVFIRNTGTAPMTVGAASASGFAFSGFSGGALAPGAFATQMVRPFTRTGQCATTETITYQVTGMVCSAPTATLPATFNITGSSSCSCS